MMNLSDL